MATICLNMIVKNEAHIIKETLDNICQYIPLDYWVISDTGSTDNTISEIQEFFQEKEIPGELYQDDWENFAVNRTLALRHADGKSDYIFVFDADDRFEGEIHLPDLVADGYSFRLKDDNGAVYDRLLLFKNNPEFHWRSVVHEYIVTGDKNWHVKIDGDYNVLSGRFGGRSQNPNKYYDDAQVLVAAFYNPNKDVDLKPRYAFYAAQSFMAAGMIQEASEWYLKFIEIGYWDQEISSAYARVGCCFEQLGEEAKAMYYWLKGYEYYPQRLESLYEAVRYSREHGHYHLAYVFAKAAKDAHIPEKEAIVIHLPIYQFLLHYELAMISYHVGELKQGWESAKRVLFSKEAFHWTKYQVSEILLNYLPVFKADSWNNRQAVIEILENFECEGASVSEVLAELRQLNTF
ncbi:glycosyltransferase [Streptococcus oralis]|nr:glycosyl transferase family protein [Streptococcus oralis subsp. tigurinus AZ_3a]